MTIEPFEVRPGTVIYNGDCLEVLKQLKDESVDSIVTDPPAGIDFMGLDWDKDKGGRDAWIAWMTLVASECLRVLKPGGHALVWALPRTSHWTATAWEDAGFEVRNRIGHIFGTRFAKSHNISKALDKQAGAVRPVVGKRTDRAAKPKQDIRGGHLMGGAGPNIDLSNITASVTEEAKQWEGFGTQLAPAIEDWWLFQKPISEPTIAQNCVKWGVGALNIAACMVPREPHPINKLEQWSGFGQVDKPEYSQEMNDKGWPANLVTDGSEEVAQYFPVTTSGKPAGKRKAKNNIYGQYAPGQDVTGYGDTGSAARFFNVCPPDAEDAIFLYAPKPSQKERSFGIESEPQDPASVTDFRPTLKSHPENWANGTESPYQRTTPKRNNHPTTKAQSLMTWLIKLITPPGGLVLDAFMGSGSTGVATVTLGSPFIGIEIDPDYCELAVMRIKAAQAPLFIDPS